MKKILKIWTLALCALVLFVACQKEDELVVSKPINELSASADSTVLASDSTMKKVQMKTSQISSSLILNALSYAKIPVYFYQLNPVYKLSYQHLKQQDKCCSWTSYVIAAGCIINGYTGSPVCRYAVSQNQVSTVRKWCIGRAGGSWSGGEYILYLRDYAQRYDAEYLSTYQKSYSKSNTLSTVKEMLYHIYTYRTPFLVTSSIGNTGHYLIVHSIDWAGTPSNSTVYYTDCNQVDQGSFSKNICSMSYDTFLSKMIKTNDYYNMLFLMPKY